MKVFASAREFKKKWPDDYNLIVTSNRDMVHDPLAALVLWSHGIAHPVCEICSTPLVITKKFRDIQKAATGRCKSHINTTNIVQLTDLVNTAKLNDVSIDLTQLGDYIARSNQITISCPKHGDYIQSIGYFIDGGQCQKCYHENRIPYMDEAAWVTKSRLIHGDFYNYTSDVTVYNGTTNDVNIVCPTHGTFTQNAGVHARGHGCRLCAVDQATDRSRMTQESFVTKASSIHDSKYKYEFAEYKATKQKVIITCPIHGNFEQIPNYHLSGCGCQKCGVEQSSYKSQPEYDIIDWLTSIGVTNIIHTDRSLGIELDIYLPDYKLAIEYDGIYWHSSGSKDTDKVMAMKHINKTKICEDNGIHLLHIWELEWVNPIKQSIWKSTIVHKLGLTHSRFYARKCGIRVISGKIASEFFNDNHLQGAAQGKWTYGLYTENLLVGAISLSKSRFRTKQDTNNYEILRYCSRVNSTVIGGFSKLLDHFVKQINDNEFKLISYANRRWSMGNVYDVNNLVLESISSPCYYYTDNTQMWHRSVFQKHKLGKLLANFDAELTEVENMYAHNYRRIWDCGSLVYTKEYHGRRSIK